MGMADGSYICVQMATLEKANGLLEQLRGASHDAAVKDMEELKKFASENVSPSVNSSSAHEDGAPVCALH